MAIILFGRSLRSGNGHPAAMLICCGFFLLILLTVTIGVAGPIADKGKKEVLYLNSYHKGEEWSDSLTHAIEDRMADPDMEVNLHTEYMDEKRYSDLQYEEELARLYTAKYGNRSFDLIITSDDNAFAFIVKNRDRLFPGTPVVFSGLNFFSDEMIYGFANVTGVVESYDIRGTLDAALRLQPGTRKVYVVNDLSVTGVANKKTISMVAPDYSGKLEFIYLENMSMMELEEQVSKLPPNSIILLMTFNRDSDGIYYSYSEAIQRIHSNAHVPIYGVWDMYLGKGIVGGMITSGYEQGNLSASLATRILNGDPVGSIPVVRSLPNRFMFDHDELLRQDLEVSRLPPDSTLINKPRTVYELHESVVWAILISTAGLVMGVAALGVALIRVRRARDALVQSERRYQAVVEDQSELICRFRSDGIHVFVNDAYCRFFEKERSTLLDSKFVPPMSREEMKKVRDHLATLTPVHPIASMDNEMRMGNGQIRWLRWSNHAIFDDTGRLIEYQSVGRDVTDIRAAEIELRQYHENLENLIEERTRELLSSNAKLQQEVAERTLAEELLAEEKERLAVTLRSIGDGVITTDVSGRVVLVNRVAERLTGWKQDYAKGRPIGDVLEMHDQKDGKKIGDPTARIIGKKDVPDTPHRTILTSRGGNQRIIEQIASIITDHDSKTIGVVIVFRDMTDRLKLEDELSRTQKLESLGLLAGGIAHDFNNILTAIFGNIMLSKMEIDKDQPSYERLIEAENAIVRAKELTQQLLTFSKGGAPVKETADISGIIIDSTKFMLRGSQSRSVFNILPGLWPVDVDVGQISQVINNIVINADHAMPGGGTITVSGENILVRSERNLPLEPGRYVRITVADQGIGISKDNLQRIFDPYFTTKSKGSGLGLSMARSIVQKHNGYIEVESEAGVGTSVRIYLPASGNEIPSFPSSNGEPVAGEGRVLVMDDEEAIREVAQALLAHLGYRSDVVEGGEEALLLYQQALENGDPYDAIIMDLTIPGGQGGKETIEKLREIDPDVKAIVSSGYSTDPIMANFREYGFAGILTKPYTAKEMSDVLQEVLQHKDE